MSVVLGGGPSIWGEPLGKVSGGVSLEAGPFCLRLRAGPVELALRFIWVGGRGARGGMGPLFPGRLAQVLP